MKYIEESHARDLHRDLAKALADGAPGAKIILSGVGVHWNCSAARGMRACAIHCFDSQGPEYLVEFTQDALDDAYGRASLKAEVIAAVIRWLDGDDLQQMYARFAFVDDEKRALTAIAETALESSPELRLCATQQVVQVVSDTYALWFKTRDRSCHVFFYSNDRLPDCVFQWDDCELFRLQTDNYRLLAVVLRRWLCDDAAPSAMRAEFHWIEIGPLADYYEQGRPIEGEFIESWNRMERFYQDMQFRYSAQALAFIAEVRRAGYDRTLRAGQSLSSLIVSRSRRHGLRRDQPHITFMVQSGSLDVVVHIDGTERFRLPGSEFTPEVARLLDRLVAREID